MGRYISTGSAQTGTNACSTIINSTCYQTTAQKYSFDANSCWQNRVIIDTPGSYTFTVPAGATCLRTIAVGGGGKAKCVCECSGFAGAGGAYVERVDTVASGCTVTIVVGRQEQDTTIAYTNSGAVARTLTAGGAAGCVAGVGSGGDWNSNGGCAGKSCNYCGGSYSHSCGTCICCSPTTCCGYCIVFAGIAATITPDHGADQCCNARYAGGGSAGSWIWPTGGAGQNAGNSVATYGASGGHGASAGGGGGIGYILRCPMESMACSCVCGEYGGSTQYGPNARHSCFPNSAGGGGGTKFQCCTQCECASGCSINCQNGMWRSGHGGWGGYQNHSGVGDCFMWGCYGTYCSNANMCQYYTPASMDPEFHPWHDIHNMCGSGSAARNIHWNNDSWCASINWATRSGYSYRPGNAGEGAGTGGVVFVCCSKTQSGFGSGQFVNWELLCCLGTTNQVCCSDRLQQSLFTNFISCAGTLGGAGGVGMCDFSSKAGKGGGAGVTRRWILCVCYGGNFNTCNGDSVTQLAYPPSELDWRLSNAGTGMAIIYWKS